MAAALAGGALRRGGELDGRRLIHAIAALPAARFWRPGQHEGGAPAWCRGLQGWIVDAQECW